MDGGGDSVGGAGSDGGGGRVGGAGSAGGRSGREERRGGGMSDGKLMELTAVMMGMGASEGSEEGIVSPKGMEDTGGSCSGMPTGDSYVSSPEKLGVVLPAAELAAEPNTDSTMDSAMVAVLRMEDPGSAGSWGS